MKNIKHRNPMLTKNGKPRVGPLNVAQLEEMITKTSSTKAKHRYRQAIAIKNARAGAKV
jgi:hypothetical protein